MTMEAMWFKADIWQHLRKETMMIHTFDTEIAEQYGLLEAILINNIYYWIEKNRANEVNFYDGTYWTYNSTRAFHELFPYVSERQIKQALKHLREEGLLLTGNYNKSSYDRTLWYALSEYGLSIVQKCPMEETEMSNSLGSNVPPIPNNKPDNKPNEKPILKDPCAETKPSAREPSPADSQADVEAVILNDGTEWRPDQALFAEYVRLYPKVDVKQQFNEMRGWCLSNPAKRKTRRGVKRFVNGWLSRAQDRGYSSRQSGNGTGTGNQYSEPIARMVEESKVKEAPVLGPEIQ
jgi:hypothetical protein